MYLTKNDIWKKNVLLKQYFFKRIIQLKISKKLQKLKKGKYGKTKNYKIHIFC